MSDLPEPETRHVRFSPGETGWVRREGGKWLLSNIPLALDLRIDDEVELDGDPSSACVPIERVVARVWPERSNVHYTPKGKEAWLKVSNAIRESGLGWTEGHVPGIGAVCHLPELTQEKLDELLRGTEVKLTATLESKPVCPARSSYAEAKRTWKAR